MNSGQTSRKSGKIAAKSSRQVAAGKATSRGVAASRSAALSKKGAGAEKKAPVKGSTPKKTEPVSMKKGQGPIAPQKAEVKKVESKGPTTGTPLRREPSREPSFEARQVAAQAIQAASLAAPAGASRFAPRPPSFSNRSEVVLEEASAAFASLEVSFEVGDNAVYPAHGVTVIKRIDERDVGGMKKRFYVLQVVENGMTIMVPTDNARAVGLRPIVGAKEIDNVFRILNMKDVRVDNTTWNRRYRECMEKIRTGSVYEIAEVLRNLYILKNNKDLSFGERKMLDTAKQLLVKELSLAKSTDEQSVEAELNAIFEGH